MTFQMHDLCGFRTKRFVRQFWRHLLVLSFLTSLGQRSAMTFRINRTLYYMWHTLIIRKRYARGLRGPLGGGAIAATAKRVSLSSSHAVFGDLSGDDARALLACSVLRTWEYPGHPYLL